MFAKVDELNDMKQMVPEGIKCMPADRSRFQTMPCCDPSVLPLRLDCSKLRSKWCGSQPRLCNCARFAGLHVLGFKPLTSLKDYHQLREPTFVYPDEKRMPGSTSAFIALHGEVLRLPRVCTKHAARLE